MSTGTLTLLEFSHRTFAYSETLSYCLWQRQHKDSKAFTFCYSDTEVGTVTTEWIWSEFSAFSVCRFFSFYKKVCVNYRSSQVQVFPAHRDTYCQGLVVGSELKQNLGWFQITSNNYYLLAFPEQQRQTEKFWCLYKRVYRQDKEINLLLLDNAWHWNLWVISYTSFHCFRLAGVYVEGIRCYFCMGPGCEDDFDFRSNRVTIHDCQSGQCTKNKGPDGTWT